MTYHEQEDGYLDHLTILFSSCFSRGRNFSVPSPHSLALDLLCVLFHSLPTQTALSHSVYPNVVGSCFWLAAPPQPKRSPGAASRSLDSHVMSSRPVPTATNRLSPRFLTIAFSLTPFFPAEKPSLGRVGSHCAIRSQRPVPNYLGVEISLGLELFLPLSQSIFYPLAPLSGLA
ncbi:hypothetical protein BCR34DRAFT_300284 [Clohesyomyces aquaticus]|uniref:Uncharacterized protein n=1 Tax=Clohesyomyces aquaticus TaxID=1231657 RepID=A0A1Y1ZQ93_9PLEO|nr:hypothetical protein BCR34DRAFT_300284 [Clohesyomyces aquaticus]